MSCLEVMERDHREEAVRVAAGACEAEAEDRAEWEERGRDQVRVADACAPSAERKQPIRPLFPATA
jgi:hypothetical protein